MDTSSDDAAPWALQLAARVERVDPPPVASICAAAALATVGLLDDARVAPGGSWHDAVEQWRAVRIRKLVRRARGAAWDRAQSVDGVTAVHGNAEVRAFVPSRMDDVPAEVAKLQIQSSPLEPAPTVDQLPKPPAGTLVVAVTPMVEMSWGKQAAQCAHGAQLAWSAADRLARRAWADAGRPLVVVHPTPACWPDAVAAADVHVHDAGFTEIPAGTNTTVAWWASPAAVEGHT